MSVSFAGHELHSPRFALEDARQLARERFGVEGAVSELGSHQDQNVLVDTGSARFVLKIANAAFGEAELDLQNRAMVHLAERLSFEVPLPCAALDGSELVAVERDGVTYLLRLVTFIEGEPLIDAEHLAPPVLRSLGAVAGEVARSLEDFEHPAADRAMQWDPRHVGAVVEALAPHVEDPRRRELVAGVARAAAEAVERLSPRLPSQIVHCDVTDWNVVGRRDRAGRLMPCGVIDFGDVTRTLRVCELAVAAASAYGHDLDDPICGRRRDRARLRRRLPARGRRAGGRPASDRRACGDRRGRHGAAGAARAAQRLRPARARGRLGDLRDRGRRAGRARRGGLPARLRAGRGGLRAARARRDVAAPGIEPGAETDLSPVALDPLTPAGAIGAHGEARFHATRELSVAEPATIHLGLDVFAPGGQEVRAPLAGRVERAEAGELVLAADGLTCAWPGSRPRWRRATAWRKAASSGTWRRAERCRLTCTSRSRRPA